MARGRGRRWKVALTCTGVAIAFQALYLWAVIRFPDFKLDREVEVVWIDTPTPETEDIKLPEATEATPPLKRRLLSSLPRFAPLAADKDARALMNHKALHSLSAREIAASRRSGASAFSGSQGSISFIP